MAFVKLPDDIRYLDLSKALGGRAAAPLEFAVFAGSAAPSPDGRSVELTSPWGAELFDAEDMPVAFREGDVGAVMAMIPPEDESGPIIAAANLDRDERADLLRREPDIRRLVAASIGRRSRFARIFGPIAALFWTLVVAACAYLAASVGYAGLSVGFEDGVALGDRALKELENPTPAALAAAALAAAIGVTASALRGYFRSRAERRRMAEALELVWDNAADAMVFVQAHLDMFRSRPAAIAPPNRVADAHAAGAGDAAAPDGLVDAREVVERGGEVKIPAFLQS